MLSRQVKCTVSLNREVTDINAPPLKQTKHKTAWVGIFFSLALVDSQSPDPRLSFSLGQETTEGTGFSVFQNSKLPTAVSKKQRHQNWNTNRRVESNISSSNLRWAPCDHFLRERETWALGTRKCAYDPWVICAWVDKMLFLYFGRTILLLLLPLTFQQIVNGDIDYDVSYQLIGTIWKISDAVRSSWILVLNTECPDRVLYPSFLFSYSCLSQRDLMSPTLGI